MERGQHSLLNKLDQMKTQFRVGKWQDYSRLIILQREQVKQAPWFFMLKLAGGSIFTLTHQEKKVSYFFQLGMFRIKDVTAKILKHKPHLSK